MTEAPNFLVVGGSGYLGQALLRKLGPQGVGTYSRNPIDGGVSFVAGTGDFDALLDEMGSGINWVVFLHGISSPDVCAKDPDGTRKINVLATIDMASKAHRRGIRSVFLSSDYVFDGKVGQRTELDVRCPTTEYGRQKAEVEDWFLSELRQSLVVRSSKIVSEHSATHSVLGQWIDEFLNGVELHCATDQIFSPMHVDETAECIVNLCRGDYEGLFNVCGTEAISRYDLCQALAQAVRKRVSLLNIRIEPCVLADIPFYEPRPLDTSLSNAKLRKALRREFRNIQDMCREVAEKRLSKSPG